MKLLVFFCCLLVQPCLAQSEQSDTNKVVRSAFTWTNDGNSFLYLTNRKGQIIFSKNDGMNGPITMIFADDYDSLGREIRSFSVHSNLGYSIIEKEYKEGKIHYYSFKIENEDDYPFDREFLNKINSRQAFVELAVFKALINGERELTAIDVEDTKGEIIEEIYVDEEGNSKSKNITEYDSLGREKIFHYGINNQDIWNWDIYYVYDDRGNMIQSYRISQPNTHPDTTEVYNYYFDENNKLISEDYYNKKRFGNRTVYETLKNGDRVEYFYEEDEDNVKVKTIYSYDDKGILSKQIKWDYRNPKKERKVVTRYKLEYW